jgi:DUF4097 and DUF4098 domain-containing protein YvlB
MHSKSAAVALTLTFAAAPALSAPAESRIEKTFSLAPGGQLTVDTDQGSVTVTGRAGPGVHVVVTSAREDLDEDLRVRFEERPHEVVITGRRRHHFFSFQFGKSVHFDIEAPAETTVRVHTSGGSVALSAMRAPARLDTSGGSIRVRDFAGRLAANTSGGSIHLDGLHGEAEVETSGGSIEGETIDGPLQAETSGGSVSLRNVTGDLRARSSGGPIRVEEAGGRVDADTSGGGIRVSFARGNGRGGTLDTSGGGIDVSLDPSVNLEIDASGESVRTDLPLKVVGEIRHDRIHGTLGSGGPMLRLHTSGGSVHIEGR